MAIPNHSANSPQQSQVFYKPGVGVTTLPVSVPRKQIQKTLGAASKSNALVAAGTGSVSIPLISLLAGSPYVINIPINLPTPLTAQTKMSLILSAPTTQGLSNLTITGLTAAPSIFLTGSATALGGNVIAVGQTVRQFAATVTISYTGVPASNSGPMVVNCQATLVTVS